jgi:hypothetical protein
MVPTILEILKYTIPALIVLILSYSIISKFLGADLKRRQLTLLHETQNITIRMRLQAYERLSLLMERIHPRQLMPRVYHSGLTAGEFHHQLVMAIRSEFEHNLSQQIYVTLEVWDTVKKAKEQELNMIHQLAKSISPDAPAKDLNIRISEYLLTKEEDSPTEIALKIIHEEARLVLSYGAV